MEQDKYAAQKNIKKLSCSFQATFVDEFKNACSALGVTQAEVIRKSMQETINQAK